MTHSPLICLNLTDEFECPESSVGELSSLKEGIEMHPLLFLVN